MGFLSLKADCAICEKEAGLNRYRIADKKWICPNCFSKVGKMTKPIQKMSISDIQEAIQLKSENTTELTTFSPTKKIGKVVEFDDDQKKWLILSPILGKRNKSTVYNYSDIVDFELLEDGDSISKGGLGRALVGGVLFGGTGAVVGGVTGKRKNKKICNSLKIKVTLKDINNPVVYINFLNSPTKTDGFIYKTLYEGAHECLSVFQLICDGQERVDSTTINHTPLSAADEILKFKELLDADIITQEEFKEKKKELLGL